MLLHASPVAAARRSHVGNWSPRPSQHWSSTKRPLGAGFGGLCQCNPQRGQHSAIHTAHSGAHIKKRTPLSIFVLRIYAGLVELWVKVVVVRRIELTKAVSQDLHLRNSIGSVNTWNPITTVQLEYYIAYHIILDQEY